MIRYFLGVPVWPGDSVSFSLAPVLWEERRFPKPTVLPSDSLDRGVMPLGGRGSRRAVLPFVIRISRFVISFRVALVARQPV